MYRENIAQFISEERAKLYIPKNGGLNRYVTDLLKEVGVREDGSFERAGLNDGRLDIITARGEDIGQRVDDCILSDNIAYGLTGDDLLDEYLLGNEDSPLGVLNTYDWFDPGAQFNRPALCLMNREGELPDFPTSVSIAVNRKYERTACRYLSERLRTCGIECNIVPYAGDTENTVAEGTHDGCVEIVYRGEKSSESALSRTGLKIVEVVRFSDISLIGRKVINPWQEEYLRITAVAQNPTGSGTSTLLADDNKICKKVGEEAAEFVRAVTLETGIPEEFNGAVYAMMVGAAKHRVSWSQIEADLKSRWR